ncbi:hypothetical protein [Dyadobacter sp. 3J3]|uniref:hypothetical protein n=1 Tax=Dyadobacter sp. 3J3 TaxID=2606600 RepID=UPI00135C50D9|nr:hypothetical protein [Dyadobacter sp. 3J3]
MGIIETIKMLTREEGFEKGIEEGFEQGIEKGIEQGFELGEERKGYKVVTKMLESGKFSVSEIASFADVSEDFVRKVQEGVK